MNKNELPKLVATDPPLECTQSDFDALLGDAAGLVDYDEASSELLDCARYGTLYISSCMYACDVHKPFAHFYIDIGRICSSLRKSLSKSSIIPVYVLYIYIETIS